MNPPSIVDHPVSRISDRDAGSEEIGSENYGAIRQPQLSIFKLIGVRLALFVLVAATKVNAETRGELVVMLKVAPSLSTETFFEIAGRKPDQRAGKSIESVVEPGCAGTPSVLMLLPSIA